MGVDERLAQRLDEVLSDAVTQGIAAGFAAVVTDRQLGRSAPGQRG